MQMKILLCSISLLLIVNCSSRKSIQQTFVSGNCPEEYQKVNFKNLKDSSFAYNGQFVEVSGYFRWGQEFSTITEKARDDVWGIGLWFDTSLTRQGNSQSKFSIEAREKLSEKKITIRGTVDTSIHGHYRRNNFTIKNICFLRNEK